MLTSPLIEGQDAACTSDCDMGMHSYNDDQWTGRSVAKQNITEFSVHGDLQS